LDVQGFYDKLGPDYDLMVSWPQRLAREEAFFQRVFAEAGARRVLDAACGTGMHAIAFARAGLQSGGADLSPVMVETARVNARAAGVEVRFENAGFGELAARFGGGFDAVTCVGNSLPHLPDDDALHSCLRDFADALRPGGVLVIQNRNYDRLLRERQRFMPPVSRGEREGETIFLRMTEFAPAGARNDEAVEFTILTLRRGGGGTWTMTNRATPLRALRRATLRAALEHAGFSEVRVYGGYAFEAFDAPGTGDLVIIASR
jgi:glycine/sarcosine N-methyltransferase